MSIKIQFMSDLHLEPLAYDWYEITPSAPYLALLGDIGLTRDAGLFAFLLAQVRQFEIVFYLLGNHEPYHSSREESRRKVKEFEAHLDTSRATTAEPNLGRFVFLDQTRYDLTSNLTILGCTLHSHIVPSQLESVSFGLNDFYLIEDWTVEEHNETHTVEVDWLNTEIQKIAQDEPRRKVIIFTHHAPTNDSRALDPRHQNSDITSGFSSDLTNQKFWHHPNVEVWVWGHTHFNADYTDEVGVANGQVQKTRYVTNQRGYGRAGNPRGWDISKCIEIDGS